MRPVSGTGPDGGALSLRLQKKHGRSSVWAAPAERDPARSRRRDLTLLYRAIRTPNHAGPAFNGIFTRFGRLRYGRRYARARLGMGTRDTYHSKIRPRGAGRLCGVERGSHLLAFGGNDRQKM